MTGDMATSVLRRIVRPAVMPEPDSVIAARALRIAMTRAAQNHADLPLSVLGIGEEEGMLDEILKGIGDDLMLVGIARRAGPGRHDPPASDTARPDGFIGIDPQTRAALIEAQMLGRVLPAVADIRVPTNADLAMAEPLVTGLLAELATTTEGTPLAGWTAGQDILGRMGSLREAGLRLINAHYRVVRLSLDLGAVGRQGLIVIVLPLPDTARSMDATNDPAPGWSACLSANVLGARGDVTAVLHRMSLPLARVAAFKVGDLVPLDGISVASVRVEALDGRLLGKGRLGQMAGMRAVRIEPPPADRLSDAPLRHRAGDGHARALPLPSGIDLDMDAMADGLGAANWLDEEDQDRPRALAQPDVAAPEPIQERRRANRPFTPPMPAAAGPEAGGDHGQTDCEADMPADAEIAAPGIVPPGIHEADDLPMIRAVGLDAGNTPDLRPVEYPSGTAVIAPIMAEMPTGIAISPDVATRGGLDLADEVDLAPPA